MVDIIARLKIRAEEFSRGSRVAFGGFERDAGEAGDRAGSAFSKRFSVGMGSLLTGAGVATMFAIGKQAMDQVSDLKKQSQQLAVSTDALQEYRYAASQVGVTQDDLSDSFADLMSKIGDARSGGKAAGEAFRDLGIDVTSASGAAKDTSDVMGELVGRLQSISDPIEQARLKAELFGDGWRQIDPLLSSGASRIHELREAAHRLGMVLGEDQIQNADETARKLEDVKRVLEANIASIVTRNSDAIIGLANAMGWAADKANLFFKTMQGHDRIQRDEGGLAAFFASPAKQAVASDPVKYLQMRNGAVERAAANVNRLRAEGASKLRMDFALRQMQDALRLQQPALQEVRWSKVKPDYSGVTTYRPTTPAPQKSTQPGRGAKSGGGGSSSGPIDAERQTEKQDEAEKRLRDSLNETIQQQRDSQRLTEMRTQGLTREADVQEVLLDLARQFPGLEGTSTEEAAKQLGIRKEQVEPLRQIYELLKQIKTTETNKKYDDQAEKDRIERAKAAQAEINKLQQEAAEQQRRSMEDLSRYYYDLFSGNAGNIWQDFKREGTEVISMLAAQWTVAMLTGQKFDASSALGGMSGLGGYGGPATTLMTALFSGRGNSLANAVAAEGGSTEQIQAAVQMSKSLGTTSQQLGSLNKYLAGIGAGQAVSGLAGAIGVRQSSTAALAGSVIGTAIGGPLGGAIGGLITGTIGGLFKKTKKGSVSLNIEDGQAAVGDAYGNSASYRRNAIALGGGVADQLNSIADALGVDLTGNASVSIGQRKAKFVVDTTGHRRTKGSGTKSYDTEEEAIEAAVRDALQDGVLGPVSEASKRLLLSGQDLDKALQKAVAIESIPKALEARLDPVGYAIDQLNEKWADTIKALQEGGATVEQMTEAQQLYALELDDVKNNTVGAAQSLKDFLSAMNAGSASPLSLREQEETAKASLTTYLDKINRGDTIDQDAYQAAAQTFLDIERQMYGSTAKYFEAFDAIQAATSTAIASIDNATPIRTSADPFIQDTATASKATASSASNIETLMRQLVDQNAKLMAALQSNSDFVGAARNF
ncbi:hypothetical protein [Sphingobium chlorophenolicum]|uniref:Uncharacterized protein n=1 Tax=Sphingobium chlorophenolicum TaxID=46429 RepID=A0A081RAC9_SPHCR|nr:hypothetical protein [Sphingobium chlorophenolicum]KEQ52152.1 hypothetical protein BV95_03569 [Sphingobium chlorophenolicum]